MVERCALSGSDLKIKFNVGEKSTSILYNVINCHARISHTHNIHGKLELQLSSLLYI